MNFSDLAGIDTGYESFIKATMQITREKAPFIYAEWQQDGPVSVFEQLVTHPSAQEGERGRACVASLLENKDAAIKLLAAELGMF